MVSASARAAPGLSSASARGSAGGVWVPGSGGVVFEAGAGGEAAVQIDAFFEGFSEHGSVFGCEAAPEGEHAVMVPPCLQYPGAALGGGVVVVGDGVDGAAGGGHEAGQLVGGGLLGQFDQAGLGDGGGQGGDGGGFVK